MNPQTPPPPGAPALTLDPSAADPLLALRDIHLPPPVPFWPPAPGWWMLAVLLVLLALLAAALEWRRRQTLGYRALRELDAIAADTARYGDARAVGAAAAVLVRRILLTRADHPGAAVLTGDGWQAFLGQGKSGLPQEVGRFLSIAPYLPPAAPEATAMDRAALVRALKRWIRGNA
ncbi:DUF4381 domain-containing protein [Azorhizobium doebereinerae]|uniref:DUF4381 domain-containing protein n=1 Tax=Azorhizobium doebereinerae TaxID=281091 RepID=UPI00041FC82B|nr:DUF4381 domain-containing protein [Azorhizobium doebereinerae]